ncbi:pentapeptide repeat-containing protein [Saccharospirillum sp.]|uniref:pentapeptide repeat-containing protein n=1 Tax=Saccharospirillum sp. TaxID=2033801 RepID=UPI0034A03589
MFNSSALTTLSIFTLVCIGIFGYWFWRKPEWMGFSGKTLWDWLVPFSLPLLLAFATVQFNQSRERIETIRSMEASLQQYIDRISQLVVDDSVNSNSQQMYAIGRAQTIAILQLVEGNRAGRVLRFLSEMDLLQRFAVSLEGVDLSHSEIKGLRLDQMDLEGADLSRSDLEAGSFVGSDFEEANLRYTDFKNADLRNASFEDARMKGAELNYADLRGADLSMAFGLSPSQLSEACLDSSTLVAGGLMIITGPTSACDGDLERR